MIVGVIGAGYVGVVTGAGLAALGHTVRVGEIDPEKVALLSEGRVPFYEADLERLTSEGIANGLLSFHVDNREAVSEAEIVILALPTPPAADGSADLAAIERALEGLTDALRQDVVVVTKSTVPVGSVARFQQFLEDRGARATVVSNPEFLREGSAVGDFFHPDRIVIGSRNQQATERLIEMYRGLQAPVLATDPESSEMIKYASNAYLATRITFANALANVCEHVGADAEAVIEGMGYDRRIGFHFLNPGPGYGGSCFPKDTRALVAIADSAGYDFKLLKGVIDVNEMQLRRIVDKVVSSLDGDGDAKVAAWGLSFKAGTDDTRESPALKIVQSLIDRGIQVVAYDPAVTTTPIDELEIVSDPVEATKDADVLLIATEWPQFASVDMGRVRDEMRGNAIVDARNVLDPEAMRRIGMRYAGVGR
ncbi:MAG: UDP-glucose/GDP-mannose dehydrogenase family protein [Acidimicrobiia bacterium]|nr:UDP-glucose/GDP-mannose dehydrogenase family protein [Acidimicrobiia bacterium]